MVNYRYCLLFDQKCTGTNFCFIFSPQWAGNKGTGKTLFFRKQWEAASKPGLTIKDKGFATRRRFSGLATKLRLGRPSPISCSTKNLLHDPGKWLQSWFSRTPFCLACKRYSQIWVPCALQTKESHLDGIQSTQTPARLCEVGMHSLQSPSGCRCLW